MRLTVRGLVVVFVVAAVLAFAAGATAGILTDEAVTA